MWKLKHYFKEPVCFKIFHQTKKLSSLCINKDPNPMYLKSHVIYQLTCPACNAEYIGKTDRCLRVRLDKHSSDHNNYSAMFQHLHSCKAFKFLFSLNNVPGCFNYKANVANFTSHIHQTILNNTTIIIACNNNYNSYNQLCFLESLLIKRYIPQHNYGINAAKELVLF